MVLAIGNGILAGGIFNVQIINNLLITVLWFTTAHLLSTSVAGDQIYKHRHDKAGLHTEPPVDDLDPQELNQLATHLPDVILNMNIGVRPPFVRQYSGVIMFLDISGTTNFEGSS